MRRHHRAKMHSTDTASGMTLLAVLILMAFMAMVSTSVVVDTSSEQQRAREVELLSVGEQYRQAIQSYWRQSPSGVRQLPTRLDDLVADYRFAQPRRHLRKLFRDPMDPKQAWVLIKVGNSVVGVRSSSRAVPFRKLGFTPMQRNFSNAQTYADWEFKVDIATP